MRRCDVTRRRGACWRWRRSDATRREFTHARRATTPATRARTSASSLSVSTTHTHTHTHPFNGPFSGTTQASWYQKGKLIWILLKQETVSGSGVSWAICKSAPRSRQITTPAPHHSVFYRSDALPATRTNSVKALKGA